MNAAELHRTFTTYDWSRKGEEWSEAWGGSEAQWYSTILPRIRGLDYGETVLEIGCGYGRWTERFLRPGRYIGAGTVIGVDLCANCVDHCRREFPNGTFHQTDGKDLSMIKDGTIDFIFSFDSLVHADLEIMAALIPQMIQKLTPTGRAFIHYSNWADKAQPDQDIKNWVARAENVSSELVRDLIHGNGGAVLVEEKISWNTDRRCVDAFTLFERARGVPNPVLLNHDTFMKESIPIRDYISKYCI